jgi:hypothetical protein
MKLPPEITLDIYGDPVQVRFDYDPGESQWFDAGAGVGGPGWDPCAEINEINMGNGWLEPDDINENDLDALQDALMEKIGEMQQEHEECRADALYDAMKEDRP